MSHTNLLVTPTGVEGGEAVVNGNCPDTLVVETECLNAALLNDGPQTNSSIRTSRQQLRRGEGRGRREGKGGEGRVLAPLSHHQHVLDTAQTAVYGGRGSLSVSAPPQGEDHTLDTPINRRTHSSPHQTHPFPPSPDTPTPPSPVSRPDSRQECARCLCDLGAPSVGCSWRCPRSESSEEKVGVESRPHFKAMQLIQ